MRRLLLILAVALPLGACSSGDGGGQPRPSGLYVGGSSGISQPSNENIRIHTDHP